MCYLVHACHISVLILQDVTALREQLSKLLCLLTSLSLVPCIKLFLNDPTPYLLHRDIHLPFVATFCFVALAEILCCIQFNHDTAVVFLSLKKLLNHRITRFFEQHFD